MWIISFLLIGFFLIETIEGFYKTICAQLFNTDKIEERSVDVVQNCYTISLSEEFSKKLYIEYFQNN